MGSAGGQRVEHCGTQEGIGEDWLVFALPQCSPLREIAAQGLRLRFRTSPARPTVHIGQQG